MKTRAFKLLSVLLSFLLLLGVAVVPLSADEGNSTTDTATTKDNHELTDNDLFKAYGLDCKTDDAEDGTNKDIGSAAIKSTESGNGYMEFKIGDSGSYPIIYLDGVPTDMIDYTYSMDVIVANGDNNKLFNLLYGTVVSGTSTKNAEFGFRYGAYKDDSATQGEVKASNLVTIDSKTLYVGQGVLANSTTTVGTVHTLEVTVKATAMNTTPTVTLKFDGVVLATTATTNTLSSSKLGISGYKGSTFGLDNIKVTNNATGEVVKSIDFEDHSYGDTLQSVNDELHGFTCVCGVAISENHTWDAGVEFDDETSCTTKKSMKYTCTVCNHEKVVANQHTPGEQVTVDATCFEDGYTSISCTVCKEELERTVIECDGHDYGLWEKITNGKKRTCTVCGDVEEVLNETTAPETTAAPETNDQTNDSDKDEGGCGSVVASPLIGAVLVGGALLLAKKKKED